MATVTKFEVDDRVIVTGSPSYLLSTKWKGARGVVSASPGADVFEVEIDGAAVAFFASELALDPGSDGKIRGSSILTHTGRYVDPLDLKPDDVTIEDVAHALSNQTRYSGHVSTFYSVAEHSVRVAAWLNAEGFNEKIVLWGLLHDASEAYLVDLPRPLKDHEVFGREYRRFEDTAMEAVAERFGLEGPMPISVKSADLVLLATERRDLMPPGGVWAILDGVSPMPDAIVPWSPEKAKREFLSWFESFRDGGRRWSAGARVVSFKVTPGEWLTPLSFSFGPARCEFPADCSTSEPCVDCAAEEPVVVSGDFGFPADTKPTNPKDVIGSEKLPIHLWPETATMYGCLGLLDGALKYGRANWRETGVRASIYIDAARRHLAAWFEGEDDDPDSGVPHLSHALACLAIIVDADAAGMLNDDRQFPGGHRPLVESLTPHVARLKQKHGGRAPRHFTIADV